MNKRRLHHVWTKLRNVKPWYFLVLTLISGVICVFALRANNEHMIKLRDDVYQADQNGGDVTGALQKLQAYVTRHMNTNLAAGPNAVYPPIQLKYTYDRLVQAQSAKLGQGNTNLYTDAEHYCEQQNPNGFSGRYRIDCVTQYVQSHGGSVAPLSVPDSLYKFSFVSPPWSPDLAGWSLLATILFVLLTVASYAIRFWLKHYTNDRPKIRQDIKR